MSDNRARSLAPSLLIVSAQQGDRGAIEALLAASQPDIRRYARQNCRIDDIDDAVQDAMWLLTRRIGALRVVAAFPAWLFEIVRRECRRLSRRWLSSPTAIEDMADEGRFSVQSDLDLRLDLASAIQSLPDHYRIVILMRDVEELTVDEIAAAVGVTRESVKARLHRARGLIREYLRD